jgi:hypothetical protein
MLLTMLFDDEDEEYVSALFQVGDQVCFFVYIAELAAVATSAAVVP